MLMLSLGECLGGALWWEDLVRLAQEVGFSPPRLVTANVITVDNMELEAILGETCLTRLQHETVTLFPHQLFNHISYHIEVTLL